MLRQKLSALSLSCFAQKASDLPSWQIPLGESRKLFKIRGTEQ
jgi:hypothetical protein